MESQSYANEHNTNTAPLLSQIISKDLQSQILHEVLPFFITGSISCLCVVMDAVVTEHSPEHILLLLGAVGLFFHFYAVHFYTSQTSNINPYGGFLMVVFMWLLWGNTGCFQRSFQLDQARTYFSSLSISDVWIGFTCILSELFMLFPPEITAQLAFSVNFATFFFVAPYTNAQSEMLQIQMFLVYITRYFIVYQVRRFVLGRERSFITDYAVAISGVWILMSRNFIAILIGIVVSISCQLLVITLLEPAEKKKN